MPEFLQKKTGIDLDALSQIKTYDDLLRALGNTPYAKVIAPLNRSRVNCSTTPRLKMLFIHSSITVYLQ